MPSVKSSETRISVILYVLASDGKLSSQEIHKEIDSHSTRFTSITKSELMATFDSPARAVKCAEKLLAVENGNHLRISLHVGECYTDDGKPLAYVSELSRKAIEYASGGEILMTQTLHDILAGSKLKLQPQTNKADVLLPDDMVLYTLT
jgi:hypothetical protein